MKRKLTCFWCGKKYVDLIKHTEKQHPGLSARSYDLLDTKPLKGKTLIIADENQQFSNSTKEEQFWKDCISAAEKQKTLKIKETNNEVRFTGTITVKNKKSFIKNKAVGTALSSSDGNATVLFGSRKVSEIEVKALRKELNIPETGVKKDV